MTKLRCLLPFCMCLLLVLTGTVAECQDSHAASVTSKVQSLSGHNVRVKERDGTIVEGKLATIDKAGFYIDQKNGVGRVHVDFGDVQKVGTTRGFFSSPLGIGVLVVLVAFVVLVIIGASVAAK